MAGSCSTHEQEWNPPVCPKTNYIWEKKKADCLTHGRGEEVDRKEKVYESAGLPKTVTTGEDSLMTYAPARAKRNSAMDGPKPGLRKEEGRAWGQHPHLVKKTTLQKHAQQMKTILPSWKRQGLVYQGV